MGMFYLLVGPDPHFSAGIYIKTSEKNQIAKFSFGTTFELNIFVS